MLTPKGEVYLPFNTPQMLRGHISGSGSPLVAILPGEEIEIA